MQAKNQETSLDKQKLERFLADFDNLNYWIKHIKTVMSDDKCGKVPTS
jgi:hypothetical protein